MLSFVEPGTGEPLVERDRALVRVSDGRVVAAIEAGIPRFVSAADNYAESFGWQWKKWVDTLSDSRNTGDFRKRVLLERTHFAEYEMDGKSLLECGMGGGDDTEALLLFPFGDVHSFDLSTAVERAREYLGAYVDEGRLALAQASLFDIPYADRSFDFVFCHRVLQHTPDPERGLRSVCAKVRPGGVLFAHCYRKHWRDLVQYKYKYRWLTKRLPKEWIGAYVERCGARLRDLNEFLRARGSLLSFLAQNFVPFNHHTSYGDMDRDQLLDLAKLNTFDALTPLYDKPMTATRFRAVIESEGFRVEHFHGARSDESPLYCTAIRTD